jgi:serine protease inhibitor
MRRRWIPLLVTVFAAGTAGLAGLEHRGAAAVPAPAPITAGPTAAVSATDRLALGLLTRLGGGGNAVFSPYSIEAALAMVDQGARGATASQIGHVLGGGAAGPLGAANRALAAALAADTAASAADSRASRATLLVANGLWVRRGLPLEPPFATALATDFGAAPRTLDLAGAPDAARRQINDWIAAHTGQLIKDLMGPAAIDARTALVLADAIYLKARWASPFIARSTAPAAFTTAPGRHVRTPFMTQPATSFAYRQGPGYRAIDLPYRASRLSMLAVMPTLGTLPAFERRLTPAALAGIAAGLRPHRVDLSMPRLSLGLRADLIPALSALGMPVAFTDGADFAGITRATSLEIAAVQHGAVLKVDEAGTVAAAATGVTLTPTAEPIARAIRVSLDHPFLLFLRDDRTGAVLFAARVANPALGQGS